MTELLRALALLAEPPGPAHARFAELLGLGTPDEAAHTETFLFQLPPHASVYLGPEGMLGGEAADRVVGFWRALGWDPPAEPDHLATLVGTYATLTDEEDAGILPAGHARRALLTEHLLPWLPAYLGAVTEVAPEPYPSWARLLADALRAESDRTPAPPALPLHLREAPGLPDPRDDGPDEFLGGLLAPVRAGWIVTRATLRRAADDLELGLRAGERRYALRGLLSQDAAGVLGWLAAEAPRAATAAWQPWTDAAGPTAAFWLDRAARTAALLTDLAAAATRANPALPRPG